MALTPNDQVRQFDFDRGVPRSILTSLAAPPATAATAETRANNLVTNGSDGTGAGTNTPRPKAGSVYISGGTLSSGVAVAAGSNPAPPGNAQRDAIREANEIASVGGSLGPPTGLAAAAPTGSSPTASVVLTWVAPTTGVPTGYNVEKKVGSGAWGAGTPATPAGAAVTVTETGLSSGTVMFRVSATLAGAKNSGACAPVSVTIP